MIYFYVSLYPSFFLILFYLKVLYLFSSSSLLPLLHVTLLRLIKEKHNFERGAYRERRQHQLRQVSLRMRVRREWQPGNANRTAFRVAIVFIKAHRCNRPKVDPDTKPGTTSAAWETSGARMGAGRRGRGRGGPMAAPGPHLRRLLRPPPPLFCRVSPSILRHLSFPSPGDATLHAIY